MAVSPVRGRPMMSHRSIIPPGDALPRRMPMPTNGQTEARKLHARLKHPIIDADGHWAEYAPLMREEFRRIGGGTAGGGPGPGGPRIPHPPSVFLAGGGPPPPRPGGVLVLPPQKKKRREKTPQPHHQ